MSKPRPANMFQYPQESDALAPMRDKLLFIEALAARWAELNRREMAVAMLLTLNYSTTDGAAFASMQWIADALTMDKRNVGKVLRALERKGWFLIQRGSRGRGKDHANRYVPNVEKVSAATPFKAAAERLEAEKKKVSKSPEKVSPATLDTGTSYLYDSSSVPLASRAAAGAASRARARAQPTPLSGLNDAAFLRRLEDLIPDYQASNLGHRKIETVKAWHFRCETIWEVTPLEDPINRQAYRLCDQLTGILRDLAGPSGPKPPRTSGPAFGKWVIAESQRRKIPPDYIAETLGVTVPELAHMTAGKVQWSGTQRKRVVEALTRYRLNGPVP